MSDEVQFFLAARVLRDRYGILAAVTTLATHRACSALDERDGTAFDYWTSVLDALKTLLSSIGKTNAIRL